jgi:amidophosphoribosyltransferase
VTGDVTVQDIQRINHQRVGQAEEEDDASRLALPNASE